MQVFADMQVSETDWLVNGNGSHLQEFADIRARKSPREAGCGGLDMPVAAVDGVYNAPALIHGALLGLSWLQWVNPYGGAFVA